MVKSIKNNPIQGYSWNFFFLLSFSLFVFWALLFSLTGEFGVKYSHDILVGILGASSAILAISFSFSQFTMSRISSNYSPFVLQFFNTHRRFKIPFFFLYSIILISVFSLSVDPMTCQDKINSQNSSDVASSNQFCKPAPFTSDQIKSGLIYLNTFVFSTAMVFFVAYFLIMIKLLNPLEFSSIVKDMAVLRLRKIPPSQFVKNTIDEKYSITSKELSDLIASIGDTAIKLLLRHENRISILYLEALRDIALVYVASKNESDSNSSDSEELYSNNTLVNNPMVLIIEQLTRFFKISYNNEEYDTSKKIISIGESILTEILHYPRNDFLIQLFTYDQRPNPFYYSIQKLISSDKNDRKEKSDLIKSLFRLIVECRNTDIPSRYVDHFLPTCLFDIIKIMIDNDDLIGYEYFIQDSTIWFHEEPNSLYAQIDDELHLGTNDPIINQIFDEMDLRYKIRITFNVDFGSCKNLISDVVEYGKRLSAHQLTIDQTSIQKQLDVIIGKIWFLYILSLTYKAIFWIGAYLLFKKPNTKYIDLFWNVNTSEENQMFWINKPLVTENSVWNTLLYFFENKKEVVHSFDLFRDSFLHLEKFFLMTLIKSSEDYLLEIYSREEIDRLFLNQKFQIIFELLSICDTIQNYSMSTKLADFNDYTINKILKIDDFMKNANRRLEQVKLAATLLEKAIKQHIQLPTQKSNKLQNLIHENYEKTTEMEKFTQVTFSTRRSTSHKTFLNPTVIDKRDIWDVPKFDRLNDHSIMFVHSILKFEQLQLIETISKNKKMHNVRTSLDDLWNTIQNEVMKMKQNGIVPDSIVIPFMLRNDLEKKLSTQIHAYLDVDNIRLLVASFPKMQNNEIYLIPKKSIETNYVNYRGTKLDVGIWENENDPRQVIIQPLLSLKIKIMSPKTITKIIVS